MFALFSSVILYLTLASAAQNPLDNVVEGVSDVAGAAATVLASIVNVPGHLISDVLHPGSTTTVTITESSGEHDSASAATKPVSQDSPRSTSPSTRNASPTAVSESVPAPTTGSFPVIKSTPTSTPVNSLEAHPSLGLPSLGLPSLSLPSLGLPSLGLPSLGLPTLSLPDLGLLPSQNTPSAPHTLPKTTPKGPAIANGNPATSTHNNAPTGVPPPNTPALPTVSKAPTHSVAPPSINPLPIPSLPSIGLPSLPLPLPSLPLPSLHLPSLPLPSLPLPSLPLPSLPLPSLPLPSLPLPSLPPVTSPAIQTTSLVQPPNTVLPPTTHSPFTSVPLPIGNPSDPTQSPSLPVSGPNTSPGTPPSTPGGNDAPPTSLPSPTVSPTTPLNSPPTPTSSSSVLIPTTSTSPTVPVSSPPSGPTTTPSQPTVVTTSSTPVTSPTTPVESPPDTATSSTAYFTIGTTTIPVFTLSTSVDTPTSTPVFTLGSTTIPLFTLSPQSATTTFTGAPSLITIGSLTVSQNTENGVYMVGSLTLTPGQSLTQGSGQTTQIVGIQYTNGTKEVVVQGPSMTTTEVVASVTVSPVSQSASTLLTVNGHTYNFGGATLDAAGGMATASPTSRVRLANAGSSIGSVGANACLSVLVSVFAAFTAFL